MAGSLLEKLPYLPQILARPGWLTRFLLDRDATFFPNVLIPGKGPLPANDVRKVLAGAVVTWEDMKWIRAVWPGPILAKGVMTGDDARRALDEGCAGVIVSNHGGRQLDTCYPTTLALPEVLEAVGERSTVIVDGGIRRGADIVKALCMGAKAVFIGRAYAYGLAAESQAGIARSIAILRADLERTLAHLGCGSIRDLGPQFIHRLGRS